jgi:hypothetical protein
MHAAIVTFVVLARATASYADDFRPRAEAGGVSISVFKAD